MRLIPRRHAEVVKQHGEIPSQLVADYEFILVGVPIGARLTAGHHLDADRPRPGVSFGGEIGDHFEQLEFSKRIGDERDPPVGGPVHDIDRLLRLAGGPQMRLERLAPGR